MRIRRYTGKDAQEAMLKVKMDLGNEAIILSTRKVRKKGFFTFLKKPLTEVLAAIDEDYGDKKNHKVPPQKKNKQGTGLYNRQGSVHIVEEENRVDSLEDRVKQMESMLERIYDNVSGKGNAERNDEGETKPQPKPQPKVECQPSPPEKVQDKKSAADNIYVIFQKVLAESEIDPIIMEKIIDKTRQLVKEPRNMKELFDVAEKIIANVLGEAHTIQFREDGRPTIVLFVGPTGVGKTTTLAKIAAGYSLNHQKKIGMITADTYRIAAVEQLKTYAEILNIPVSVIYTPQEVKEAISQHADKDLILIDTAGRSHKNPSQFSEIKMLAAAADADEVFLVLSCSMSRKACKEILKHYSFLRNYKLLFTKLDEAHVPGVILNARYITGKRLSYTTAGQSVPDDIEIANIESIAKSILNSYGVIDRKE